MSRYDRELLLDQMEEARGVLRDPHFSKERAREIEKLLYQSFEPETLDQDLVDDLRLLLDELRFRITH